MQDLADHAFENFRRTEAASLAGSTSERAWLRWVAAVEAQFAHYEIVSQLGNFADGRLRGLDGDQSRDGFSLDFAHDAFRKGQTPDRYVANVQTATGWVIGEPVVRHA